MKKDDKKANDDSTKNPEAMVSFYQYQYKRRIWAAKVRKQRKG